MDWRRLRSSRDVESNGLVRVTAKAFHFEIAVTRVERIAERGRWLRRSLKAENALIPSLAGQTVGGLARLRCLFRGSPNRRTIDALS